MGHDLTPSQRLEVERAASDLASMASSDLDLRGTRWRTLYNNAAGGSSGKIGPFISTVTQTFHPTLPQYCNEALFFGALALKLEGVYKINLEEGRIDLEFTSSSFELFTRVLSSKAFVKGEMMGHWKILYKSDDMRVFTTNKGSLFILDRLD